MFEPQRHLGLLALLSSPRPGYLHVGHRAVSFDLQKLRDLPGAVAQGGQIPDPDV